MNETKRHSGFFLFESEKGVLLFHRPAASDSPRLLISSSHDGAKFTQKNISGYISSIGKKGKPFGNASSFRAAQLDGKIFLSFFDHDADSLEILSSDTGTEWESVIKKRNFGHPTVLVETASDKRHAIAAFSASGRKFITLSLTDKKFKAWNLRGVVLEARPKFFDVSGLSPLSVSRTKHGIVLVYTAINREGSMTIGAALFDAKQPEVLLWRSASPIWTAPEKWLGTKMSILGGANVGKYYYAYFQSATGEIETFPMSRLWETYLIPSLLKPLKISKVLGSLKKKKGEPEVLPEHQKITISVSHRLSRHAKNPILEPRQEQSWEAFSAFNAAALMIDDKIHLLYRAQGHDGISVLGHAVTEDGMRISKRSSDPVFVPSNPFDVRKLESPYVSFPYVSGGGWGGCEDPRITRIGSRIYMTYVAFNGSCPPGVALTSIRTRDFGKNWEWSIPRLISRPNQTQKNWVIFPEKINGKYALLHNISPTIRIAYLDSLDDPDLVIDSTPPRPKDEDGERWDNIVRGVGAPPIRMEHGWIVLYHAMDRRDPNRYKVGAMLLDLEHPETVLARSSDPILEPEADYENHGHKQGVVYVCGAVIKDGTLFVYYGASDRSLAVATANLDRFVTALRKAKPPKLTTISLS